jgi:ribosomal protein L7/L12
VNAPRLNVSDAVLDEVLQCLARGHKLEAVKILKTATGLSLMESKQIADQLEAEQGVLSRTKANPAGADWQVEAKRLLLQGQKIQAVQLCREKMGYSLQEAKERVEELAARQGIPDRSIGCTSVLIVVIVIGAIAGGIYWAMI